MGVVTATAGTAQCAPVGPGWIVSPPVRKLVGPVVAAVAVAALAACQGGPSDANAADRQFARTITPIEYQAATITMLAPDRAKNDEVKDVAGRYHAESEHAVAVVDGRATALRTKIRNDALTQDLLSQQSVLSIQDEHDEAFDRDFVNQLMQQAQVSTRLYQAEAKSGGDPFLRGLGTQMAKIRGAEVTRMQGMLRLLPAPGV